MGRNESSSNREFKMIGFPEQLYLYLREFADEKELTNRCVIRKAVESHLDEVLRLCADAGHAPAEGERKLVRTALDPGDKARLDGGAEKSGVDATALLILCLRHELRLRLKDRQRPSILARIKHRLARSKSPQRKTSKRPSHSD